MSEASPAIAYRDIPEFPGYRVGDDGSVWSCRSRNGLGDFGPWREKRVKPDSKGYIRVGLMRDKKFHFLGVHRLVLIAFIDSC